MDPKPSMAASNIRPAIRHRGLLLATITLAAAAAGMRYQASSMRTNELNQRSRAPYHVSVDRSGGGV
ncbi:hypothetical protein CCHL11_01283 [Colletotrichum chlorophyti]|uniref:Uncharacterized protein n=1 Tax=Colletotrichum chlorophyti TaxID=708187 RepID=A0A1Q8S785_9PEZI|nr:hypothetical protein CCHL11_01283 [Colletotrichum chlorophyti]